MGKKQEKGAITVFLCIIIMIMMVLACILVDGVRIRIGEVQVKRTIESSLSSALAGYNSSLKKKFGLFALNKNNTSSLQEEIRKYMMSSLSPQQGLENMQNNEITKNEKFIDLYNYKIEDLKVTPLYNLSENDITRKEILEYMKYRAPKLAVERFWGKAAATADIGKAAEISELKMKIDKFYMDIIKDQNDLYELVKKINKFNYKTIDGYAKTYIKAVNDFRKCAEEIKNIQKKIENIQSQPGGMSSGKELEKLKEKLKEAKKEQAKVERIKDNQYEKIQVYLQQFINLNTSALTIVKRLGNTLKEINKEISELKKRINAVMSSNSSYYLKDLTNEILSGSSNNKRSVKNIEKKLPSEQNTEIIANQIQKNNEIVQESSDKIKKFDIRYARSITHGSPREDMSKYFIPSVNTLYNFYNKISVGEKMPWIEDSSLSGKDSRSQTENNAKKLFETHKETTSLLKTKQKELPSYITQGKYPNKIISMDFTRQDNEVLRQNGAPLIKHIEGNQNYSLPEESVTDIAGNLNKEIDFKNNDFFNKAFKFVENLGSSIARYTSAGLQKCRDELYIDEYVIGTFNNAVPILKDGTNTTLDLSGNLKQKAVNYEIEYILCGNTSEKFNLNYVKGEILLIRFAIDTINDYKDPKKVDTAIAIAAASSSWWSFGLATPIVYNLILCSWGMTDAINDVNHLMKGDAVPMFKNYEKMSSGTTENNKLTFSYHDYLRIFLLIENPENKMNRIQDLIQLKSGKKIAGYNTCLRVEATVSMKYLFMTEAFMPKKFKMSDGSKHKIKAIVYKDY